MRYKDDDGEHLKVGITSRSLEKRYRGKLQSIEAAYHGTLGECFRAEQEILAEAKRRGWRYSSSSTTELIQLHAYSEVQQWILQGGLGDSYTH
jgi:hypothetical protein